MDEHNPQTVRAQMKDGWVSITKALQKTLFGLFLVGQLQLLYREKYEATKTGVSSAITLDKLDALQKKIVGMERKIHTKNRISIEAKDLIEGASPSKYLTRKLKGNKPWDIMYRLHTENWSENHSSYVSNGKKMAKRARNYYNNRQTSLSNPLPNQVDASVKEIRTSIERRLTDKQRDTSDSGANPEILDKILKKTNNESASGPNRKPFAIWKVLAERHDKCVKKGEQSAFNMTHTFAHVLKDIKQYDICNISRFAESLMNPLFKSSNRDAIENYRPISCCNADYKWYEMLLAFDLV
jgi:hypothetical protein